jgi:nucleotide-binding universal stress UspA family protein
MSASDQEQAMNSAQSPGPVVVGFDGSEAAIGAAKWAAREAIHHDVPLRLVYVVEIADLAVGFADDSSAEDGIAESALRAALLAVEATELLVKVDTAVLHGDVDSALIAESSTATLICVGSVGIGWVATMVLGSTAAILAQEAHCSMAIMRHGDESPRPEAGLIAVVVDDSPGNGEVVRCAMEEARMRQAPVLALYVGRQALFERSRDKFYRRLDGVLRRFPDVEVEVATTRLGMTRCLQERIGAVQLIVIGSGDAGRVTQFVGPHGLPILRHADCSVLVARGADHLLGAFPRRAS